ncbi:MAG: ATP-dependent Clp protease ATP-binding subunit [Firmicutes bacterium]|nr:ATP-dependent Clp protease ATP-binding subunit [Bacillota bacterium]
MQFPITDNLSKALQAAKEAANRFSNPGVGTEHVLYGLAAVKTGIAYNLLKEAGVTEAGFEPVFKGGEHPAFFGGADFTDRVKQTFLLSYRLAQSLGERKIGTEHILYCMLSDPTGMACQMLAKTYKANIGAMQKALQAFFEKGMRGEDPGGEGAGGSIEPQKRLPAQLNELGVDITRKVKEQKTDPIIGRAEEIERIIQILCRKTKNNPVLIGEPGVGKTAVIEGLAKAIVEGAVPELLKGKIVYGLDIGSLVAGTKYRGALEEKLKTAIELIKQQGDIIVFIDELHTLAQAGAKEGEVSPADILKPYLARGELQTIGATTTDEYRKYIEKDKALERRFQPIIVNPPSVDETVEILKGIKENYEAFHKVRISDEALEAAAKLSDRYISDRFLPDKAIDLIDEAMSRAKVSRNTAPPDVKHLEEQLINVEQAKKEAVKHEDFKKAASLRDEAARLSKKIDDVKLEWSKQSERATPTIAPDDIAAIVAKWTKIPVTRLTETETERLIRLEETLHKRVIGQEAAVTAVSKAIRRARAGLKDASRPVGTFLFLGPTGVGKTELTKALSEALFDDENAIVRLDMSEYMEAHSVSKLIGAPPGYVGFDDGGQLTEALRRKPYSVVLFDEIEKAHPDVTNALLQIMDDGRLTDAQGRVVSFKNAVVIMTSNVGAENLKKSKSLGFGDSAAAEADEQRRTESVLTDALRRAFKPEFLNRIDVTCIFRHLTKEEIGRIADILLQKVARSLAERKITLNVSENAKRYLIEKGYDPEFGARPLRRVIQTDVEDGIAEALLTGKLQDGAEALVDLEGGEIVIT